MPVVGRRPYGRCTIEFVDQASVRRAEKPYGRADALDPVLITRER